MAVSRMRSKNEQYNPYLWRNRRNSRVLQEIGYWQNYLTHWLRSVLCANWPLCACLFSLSNSSAYRTWACRGWGAWPPWTPLCIRHWKEMGFKREWKNEGITDDYSGESNKTSMPVLTVGRKWTLAASASPAAVFDSLSNFKPMTRLYDRSDTR